uniref:Uncharacterized protein n=1 Tax=Elaeophora elaphi TaxID=1147741 RepID=A0A0R3RMZ6_9BILA
MIYDCFLSDLTKILQLQIETEGHTLVNERGADRWIQRRQRHLKTLTKRWYHLWIRSLSVQCQIERQLDHLCSIRCWEKVSSKKLS